VGEQQQGLTEGATKTDRDRVSADPPQLADARKLAEAFYRGLGGEVTAVTAAIRRRDLVIASDLVGAGATPSEAEAYAVETGAVSGRISPVDLRSFERERFGWLTNWTAISTAIPIAPWRWRGTDARCGPAGGARLHGLQVGSGQQDDVFGSPMAC
jgi:hypothetical protein